MNDKRTISNIALAKEILGKNSSSFRIIEKEPELFEMMFPGVLEYVKHPNEKSKQDFLEAFLLFTDIEREIVEREFVNFIYPVRLIKDKLNID